MGRACKNGKDWRQKNEGFGVSGSQGKKQRTPSRREQHPPLWRRPVQSPVPVSDFMADAMGGWGRRWYGEPGSLLPALPLEIMDEIGAKNSEEFCLFQQPEQKIGHWLPFSPSSLSENLAS